jgi:hypothetical protein
MKLPSHIRKVSLHEDPCHVGPAAIEWLVCACTKNSAHQLRDTGFVGTRGLAADQAVVKIVNKVWFA